MARHYTIFVEFCQLPDSLTPTGVSLEVHVAEPEFCLLLGCLNASPGVESIVVYNKSQVTGHLTRMLRGDIDSTLEKIK